MVLMLVAVVGALVWLCCGGPWCYSDALVFGCPSVWVFSALVIGAGVAVADGVVPSCYWGALLGLVCPRAL